MNEYDFTIKIKEMITDCNEYLLKECKKLFESGGVDTSKFSNDYILPKIVLTVALNNAAYQYEPHGKEYKKDMRNLSYF